MTQAKDNLIAQQQAAAAQASQQAKSKTAAAADAEANMVITKAAGPDMTEHKDIYPLTHFAFMYARADNDEFNFSPEVREEKETMKRKMVSGDKRQAQ